VNKSNGDKASVPILLSKKDIVKVTQMNHIVEVQHMEKMNRKNHIKKLDKDRYVDITTGEIKDFEHSVTRKDNENSLRQTFKRLRYLINNNFVGSSNELHITLTYKENMIDTKRLYEDFDKFMKRLRYAYKKQATIDYLTVVEPQGRGAWHCHVLIRFNDLDKVYIKNKDLREMWGHGFVTIKSLKDVDNIGAYLSAYLTDIELDIEKFESGEYDMKAVLSHEREVATKIVDGKEKKFIKGGRLHMYPPGMNLYRNSKGIVPPDREEMRFGDIKKIVGAATPHYQKSYHIQTDEFENTITFIQYNKKRSQ
jgi:hypothetical protein